MLNPREINAPLSKERITESLKKRLPDYGRKAAISLLSTEIGRSESAVSNWVHGINAPDLDGYFALCAHYRAQGDHDFVNETLDIPGYGAAPLDALGAVTDASRLVELEAAVTAMQKTLDNLNVTPLRGEAVSDR